MLFALASMAARALTGALGVSGLFSLVEPSRLTGDRPHKLEGRRRISLLASTGGLFHRRLVKL